MAETGHQRKTGECGGTGDIDPRRSSGMPLSTTSTILRFAPSPNGELHIGHAYSAMVTWDMAERLGGQALLRIEDIDLGRTREDFVDRIFADLAWLGLDWPRPVRRQSQHFGDYRRAAKRLEAMGLVYRCYATRSEIKAAAASGPAGRDPDGAPLYPGRGKVLPATEMERRASDGAPFTLRLDMAAALAVARELQPGPLTFRAFDGSGNHDTVEVRPERWGDQVIVRKDTPTSYHLSVVVDDAIQGVSHVTRGVDLLAATDLHRLLQVLLALPEPAYHHHRLVTDDNGEKLSKSLAAQSLRALRDDGTTPDVIRQMLELSGGVSL